MPTYCFETLDLKELFQTVLPTSERVYAFEELVEHLTGFTIPHIPLSAHENTIELLRRSLVLTQEHVEHCFSCLPATPKNTLLKKDFIKYLKSTQSLDFTHAVWTTIGALKEKKLARDFDAHWVFVPSSEPGFIFQEFAKAFTYANGVENNEIKTFGSILPISPPARAGKCFYGSTSQALISLASAIELALKTAPTVYVPFSGEPEERAFLQFALRSKHISVSEPPLPPPTECEFVNIRTNKHMGLRRRLELWHKLKEVGSLARARELEFLTEDELKNLQGSEILSPSPSRAKPQVHILNWICPPFHGVPILAFASERLLEIEPIHSELTNGEHELLFQAGFPIPRVQEIRRNRLQIIAELHYRGATLFTSLPRIRLPLAKNDIEDLLDNSAQHVTAHAADTYPLDLPQRSFSATQLETYAICPSRYLFANRLKLRRTSSGMESFALFHGQATHRALELFFASTGTDAGSQINVDALLPYFTQALLETNPHLDVKSTLYRTLRFQFIKTIPSTVVLELQLTALFGARKPKYFEKEFSIDLNGSTFRGKIDRIDELNDGSLLVLDYKTGTIDFTPEHIRKGTHFQALIYLIAAESLFSQPTVGMLFYDLKGQEIRRGLLIEERVSPETKKAITRGHTLTLEKYRTLVEAGLHSARAHCENIRSGKFAPNPSPEHCSYCDLPSHCRRADGVQ